VKPGRTLVVTRRQLTNDQWEFIEPYLPIGRFGPYPERLREQFEGVIWRFRSGAQWREMPSEFGPWATVYGRFRVWRDAGVFTALLEGMIALAARAGRTDLSLVSVDSTTARAHHDAAGMRVDKDLMEPLEEAAREQEEARQKGANRRNRTDRPSVGASGADASSACRKPSSAGPGAA
jgi:transposase